MNCMKAKQSDSDSDSDSDSGQPPAAPRAHCLLRLDAGLATRSSVLRSPSPLPVAAAAEGGARA